MSREETAPLRAVPGPREISPRLLEALVCPLTKGPLEYRPETQELVSRNARLAYPIRDGLPIMLPSEARKLDV
ncbi:Trm112 family protein [Neomegalonema sp.]|uniref:Trm112 family protein n=1 Tax=Neomegalonema sp. TaxID=2039713 RepID=UPI00263814CC|nr:Trm112 family protein [Neomegalonema sp.]MDD2867976.1 Trm112 family protein [Neomegalonema sp.]